MKTQPELYTSDVCSTLYALPYNPSSSSTSIIRTPSSGSGSYVPFQKTALSQSYLNKLRALKERIKNNDIPANEYPPFNDIHNRRVYRNFPNEQYRVYTAVINPSTYALTLESPNFVIYCKTEDEVNINVKEEKTKHLERFFAHLLINYELDVGLVTFDFFKDKVGFRGNSYDIYKFPIFETKMSSGVTTTVRNDDGNIVSVAIGSVYHEFFHSYQRCLPGFPSMTPLWRDLHESTATFAEIIAYGSEERTFKTFWPNHAPLNSGYSGTHFFSYLAVRFGPSAYGRLYCDASVPNEGVFQRALRILNETDDQRYASIADMIEDYVKYWILKYPTQVGRRYKTDNTTITFRANMQTCGANYFDIKDCIGRFIKPSTTNTYMITLSAPTSSPVEWFRCNIFKKRYGQSAEIIPIRLGTSHTFIYVYGQTADICHFGTSFVSETSGTEGTFEYTIQTL